MKKQSIEKLMVITVFSLFMALNLITPAVAIVKTSTVNSYVIPIKHICVDKKFDKPLVKNVNSRLHVEIRNINTYAKEVNKPVLPVYRKTYILPRGSKILDIKYKHSQIHRIKLSEKIDIYKGGKWIKTGEDVFPLEEDTLVYPKNWFNYKVGGMIKEGKRVTILTLELYPIRYNSKEESIEYVNEIKIDFIYKEGRTKNIVSNYDLLIVCPSRFISYAQKLAKHKNSLNIKTKILSLKEIYSDYTGYDNAEKIKEAIREEIEEDGIKYVLLIGSIDKLPTRETWIIQKWRGRYWNATILSDLYYADIYDANGSFCSWDSNGNGKYGERFYGVNGVNDTVDLYPDVYVGRLACKNVFEFKTIVDKIINYEKKTKNGNWFKRLLVIGGDTFPGWGVVEGEFATEETIQILSDFTPTKLWASSGNLNALNIQKEFNKGYGFVHYSGHGFEYGFATHPIGSDEWIGNYYTPYAAALLNGYKLPVMFFDACLTAKLDFNSSDLRGYGIPIPFDITFPCFAWFLVKKPMGGAIATIGATRVAFTHVSSTGVHAGASRLALDFFSSYHNTTMLGEMFANAQIKYLENVGRDYYTLEEFILLGDPSLKVGGY